MRSPAPARAAAVVLAAGSGARMESEGNKAYLPLAGRPMVSWTLAALRQVSEVGRLVLVTRIDDLPRAEHVLRDDAASSTVEVIAGGRSRHESEFAALTHLADDIEGGDVDVVLIHDAARPLAGPGMMRAAISVAHEFGGAVPALEAHDLVEVTESGAVRRFSRHAAQRVVRVQTPQAFRARPLLDAYRRAAAERFEGTDTSSSVERFSDVSVRSFEGDERNIKVTYAQDLFLAERLLATADRRRS